MSKLAKGYNRRAQEAAWKARQAHEDNLAAQEALEEVRRAQRAKNDAGDDSPWFDLYEDYCHLDDADECWAMHNGDYDYEWYDMLDEALREDRKAGWYDGPTEAEAWAWYERQEQLRQEAERDEAA